MLSTFIAECEQGSRACSACIIVVLKGTMKGQAVMVRCCLLGSFHDLQVGCDGDSRLVGDQQRCGQPGLAGSDAAQDASLHHPAP